MKNRIYHLDQDWMDRVSDELEAMAQAWATFEQTRVLPEHKHRFGWEEKWCSMNEQKEGAA